MISSSHVGREDDAHGQDVVDLVEGDVLLLHLVPDRERRLDARLDFVFEPHLVEGRADGRREVAEEFVALCLRLLQLLRDVLIDLRVLIAKTEVLQFGLHLVESQAVGRGA